MLSVPCLKTTTSLLERVNSRNTHCVPFASKATKRLWSPPSSRRCFARRGMWRSPPLHILSQKTALDVWWFLEFLLTAVDSSRHMPWCTAILSFWRSGHLAWIWPRLFSHSATSGVVVCRAYSRHHSRYPRVWGAWRKETCNRCIVAGVFWTGREQSCLASVSLDDFCYYLLV